MVAGARRALEVDPHAPSLGGGSRCDPANLARQCVNVDGDTPYFRHTSGALSVSAASLRIWTIFSSLTKIFCPQPTAQ